jgi:protein TonB
MNPTNPMNPTNELHKPNWLLRGLILLSVGVHLLLLMQMTHLSRPRDISRIELTLKPISSSFQRQIPKPRPRFKPLTDPQEQIVAGALDERHTPMKPFQYAMPAPIDSNRLMGKNQIPRIPVMENTDVAEWQDEPEVLSASVPSVGERRVMTERAYTDLVQKKIEALKQYPKRAQRRNDQGVVKLVFTIGINGEIVSVNIVKSSGSRILDRAAMDAVKKASPFANPPNGSIIIQLPIKFELL